MHVALSQPSRITHTSKVGGHSIDVRDSNGGRGAWLVDSGTTFTWVPSAVYRGIQKQMTVSCGFDAHCRGEVTRADPDALRCWEIKATVNETVNDLIKSFPSIKIVLNGVTLTIPPQQYVHRMFAAGCCSAAMID